MKKKKRRKSSSAPLLILLVGGGVFALVLCIGAGVAAYFLFGGDGTAQNVGGPPAPNIVGRWERIEAPVVDTYEFRADGTGNASTMLRFDFKYRQKGEALSIDPLPDPRNIWQATPQRYLVRRNGNTLIFTDENTRNEMKLKKIG